MRVRPLTEADAGELRRIHALPEVRRYWGDPEEGFPMTDEPDCTRFVIEVDGSIAGMVQYWEEPEPRYRHAGLDIFLDPAHHGRGHGTAALREMIRLLVEQRGHHRIVIDPAADNAAAIRSYEKAGFQPVGIQRCAERDVDGDGWHDVLLMELVVLNHLA